MLHYQHKTPIKGESTLKHYAALEWLINRALTSYFHLHTEDIVEHEEHGDQPDGQTDHDVLQQAAQRAIY